MPSRPSNANPASGSAQSGSPLLAVAAAGTAMDAGGGVGCNAGAGAGDAGAFGLIVSVEGRASAFV